MIDYAAAREAMVDRQVRPADVTRYPIIAAMLAVPREDFVPEALRPVAYLGEHVPLGAGPGAARPAGLRQAARRAERRAARTWCSTSAAASATRPRCWRAWPRRWSRSRTTPAMAAEAEALLGGARRSTTPWCRPGRSADGVPAHGPFDAILIEGAIEVLPEPLAGQLKPGGRIAAIFVDGARGQARLGIRHRRRASPGGVSSMQRRRCCRASRRRKRLSFEPIAPDSAPRSPANGPAARAASGDRMMHRQTAEVASAVGHARRWRRARAAPAGAGRDARRRAGQGLPDQPAARIQPRRAAQPRRDACRRRAPTRRPQVGATIGANAQTQAEDFERPAQQRSGRAQRHRSCSSTTAATKAAIESARNTVAAGRADLKDVEQLVLFNAVQAYVDVRRDQEFVRLANNDVERLQETLRATAEPLRGRRGHPHRRQPERVAPRGLALDAGRRRGPARDLARGLPRRGRQLPANLEPLPPLPELPRVARRGDRDRHPAQPADHRRAVRRARRRSTTSTGRWPPRARRSASRLGRRAARQRASIAGRPGTATPSARSGSQGVDAALHRRPQRQPGAPGAGAPRPAPLRAAGRPAAPSPRRSAAAWAQLEVARASIVARREQAEAARIAAEGVAEEARLGARSTLDVLDADQERLTAEAEIVRRCATSTSPPTACCRRWAC